MRGLCHVTCAVEEGMTQTTDHRFHAYDVAVEIVGAVAPLIGPIARRDPSLAKQVREAMSSVPLNVAEGRRRTGRDRLYHYNVAAGSADEVRCALDIACAQGLLARGEIDDAQSLLDRELAML